MKLKATRTDRNGYSYLRVSLDLRNRIAAVAQKEERTLIAVTNRLLRAGLIAEGEYDRVAKDFPTYLKDEHA